MKLGPIAEACNQLIEAYNSQREEGLLAGEILNGLIELHPQRKDYYATLMHELEKKYLGYFIIRFKGRDFEHATPFSRMFSTYVRHREMCKWTKERKEEHFLGMFGPTARNRQYLSMMETQYLLDLEEQQAKVVSRTREVKCSSRKKPPRQEGAVAD